jgi:transposase
MPPPLPPEVLATLPPAIQAYIRCLEAIVVQQAQRTAQLEAQVVTLTARVAELEAKLKQDSSNSHRPPSSDGPHVKPAPPRKSKGKRRGGQAGHPKHDRVLLPADETHDCKPERCRRCCTKLVGDDPDPVIDQVLELPEKLRHVIHYRRHRLCCPRCRAVTTAELVPGAKGGFGPRLTAATAYLSGVGRLGKRTIRLLYADLFGIPMATGSVCKLEARVGKALKPVCEEALAYAEGKDANVDETGWKEGAKRAWLWVAVTQWVTVFLIRAKRNRASFDDLVGPKPGILTTDRFPVYTHLKPDKRQVCWAHLRRDFQAMLDRNNAGSRIGADLMALSDTLFEHWQKVRDGTRQRRWFERECAEELRRNVRLLLERGTRCGCAKTAAVCRDIQAVEASLWTFVASKGVEPTNNAAERALRHAVCWRKTSYGTDSERGSRFVERILTVVASCRSQGRSVLEFLTCAVDPRRAGAQKLTLLPAAA